MKTLVVLIHAAIVSASLASSSVFYTPENGESLRYRNVTEGYVVSPGYINGSSYPQNFSGSVTLIAWAPNKYIKLYFEDVDLDVSSYCSGDSLEVWEGRYVADNQAFIVCGQHRPRPWTSANNTVKIEFTSDLMHEGRGFRIRYKATRLSGLCNYKTEYQCQNRQCVPISKKCDGVTDCADASDEKYCSTGGATAPATNADVPCGTPVHRPVTEPEDRVVGGQEAVPHSWPWQVSLSRPEYELMGHFCGGSLVSAQWVLTAAHCLRGKKAKEVLVVLGMHSRLNVSDVITRGVLMVVSHPNFKKSRRNYDVALLKMDAPVDFTDSVRPICLPTAKDKDLLAQGQCFATGWGQTRGSGSFDRLKQAEITELPFKECLLSKVGSGKPEEEYTFCAGDQHGESGICTGDSGGPLSCSNNGTSWTLLGVANTAVMATETGAICGAGSDSFWNRVAYQMPWIRRTMRAL